MQWPNKDLLGKNGANRNNLNFSDLKNGKLRIVPYTDQFQSFPDCLLMFINFVSQSIKVESFNWIWLGLAMDLGNDPRL